MGDKKLKDYKGKSVVVHEDDPEVINQEPIQHPPQIQHPSNLPPGFKLQPSDDELVSFYIKNKIKDPTRFRPSFIPDTNIYDYLPQELLEGNKDMDAYFFSARNKKYQNGTRADRSVKKGYGHWRMGSKSKEITGVNRRTIGYKNSLRFYVGKNKKDGIATNWQMKEYVMCGDGKEKVGCSSSSNNMRLDDWVICRVHWHDDGKRTESTAEVDSDGNAGNSINSTCNKKRRIEKERKGGNGQAGIKIEGRENVATSSNVPGAVPHPQYGNQFNYYNPQFVGNNFANSVMPSNSMLSIQHHPQNNYQYQFGGYSGMFHQQHQQQPDQQFEQHQQQQHQKFEQQHQQFGQ
ncbi:hypothetical protein MKW98_023294 [Papaver atlanticum]|uniref:NAC domain-containing protein n=1 Tax=Papaver atlanticum TaxID=357466 RepID=A0AAD4XVD1_9MAGN|nr:hypothetical protein MKW98_023294 [Papaver atlanticum]